MIPKKQRITKRLFSESFSYSKSVSNEYLTLKYKGILEFPVKIAVVVSKKVEKSAVGRNNLKRKIYLCAQNATKSLKKPYILMIFPKKDCLKMTTSQIEHSLTELLKKTIL